MLVAVSGEINPGSIDEILNTLDLFLFFSERVADL